MNNNLDRKPSVRSKAKDSGLDPIINSNSSNNLNDDIILITNDKKTKDEKPKNNKYKLSRKKPYEYETITIEVRRDWNIASRAKNYKHTTGATLKEIYSAALNDFLTEEGF